jgi:hypothetical protein
MEDMVLKAKLDDTTTVYVSPIAPETYAEYVDGDVLGGDAGYFLLRSLVQGNSERFEILAKAPSFDAASDLFDLIVGRRGGHS